MYSVHILYTDVPRGTIERGFVMKKLDSSKSRININLPSDLKDWIAEQAIINGFSLTMMIQVMILDYKKQLEALDMSLFAQSLIELQAQVEIDARTQKSQKATK